jgi:hypothetical protein
MFMLCDATFCSSTPLTDIIFYRYCNEQYSRENEIVYRDEDLKRAGSNNHRQGNNDPHPTPNIHYMTSNDSAPM